MDKVEKEEQRLAAENSKVVSLSAESFETEVVNGKDAWLLKFYGMLEIIVFNLNLYSTVVVSTIKCGERVNKKYA